MSHRFRNALRFAPLVFLVHLLTPGTSSGQTGCVDIRTFGGHTGQTANNVKPFERALRALPSGGCIAFPPGHFRFLTGITIPYSDGEFALTIVGAGADVTVLDFLDSDGITVNLRRQNQSIHVHSLTLATSSINQFTALRLQQAAPLGTFAQSDVNGVTFRGNDGGASQKSWNKGIEVLGLSNINFDSDLFYGSGNGKAGVGISLSGYPGRKDDGVIYNVSRSGFFSEGVGLEIVTRIQGVSVTQSNFNNGQTCVLVDPQASDVTEIALTGGDQMNCLGTQVDLEAPVAAVIINGNLIYILPGGTGIIFNASGFQNSIAGNVFSGLSNTGTTGIAVKGPVSNSVVSGNSFYDLDTGVNLTGASKGWTLLGNSYEKVRHDVLPFKQ